MKNNQDENGLRWHRLSTFTLGDKEIEVLAASCEDGIGFMVQWVWNNETNKYDVACMSTESNGWENVRFDLEEETYIPEEPPTIWDDL